MSRRPARATQTDIRRALRAAAQARARVAIEIKPDGTIRLVPVNPEPKEVSHPETLEYRGEIVL